MIGKFAQPQQDHKPLFREHFRDYTEETLKASFDALVDVQRSKLMGRFFAERVLRPRYPALLPSAEEDLEACIVDGKGDQGIDFIAREEGTVLIIQAKYSGGKKAAKRPHETPTDFDSFRNVLSRLRHFRELDMAAPLRDVAVEIDWENDRFQLYYITLRQLAQNQLEIASAGITPISDLPDLADRTELYLLDETGLNQELRDTLSLEQAATWTVRVMFTKNDDGQPPWVQLGDPRGDRVCYVGRISGAQLANLFKQHKSCLFSLNIRNYIGDNSTNKAIRTTALDLPDDFFFFNNGISALATRIEPDPADSTGRTLLCEQLSVVNGAQTIRSLHKAETLDRLGVLGNVQVLLRITEFRAKKTKDEQEFLDNVTKYNNTQNSVRLSDFRSNDKVQYDIKKRFDALPAVGGKKFLYKNKRSGEREIGRIPIPMEEFAKTVYAFVFGPDDAYGGTAHVFDATKGGGYTKLFGSGGEVLPSLDNATFEFYAGVWFICNFARELWREKLRQSREHALERRWMFFYAVGEAVRLVYKSQAKDEKEAIRTLSDPRWTGEPDDSPIKKTLARHAKMAFRALSEAYRGEEGKEGFTHRNWFRSQVSLKVVADQLKSSWELLAEHADEYVLPRARKVS